LRIGIYGNYKRALEVEIKVDEVYGSPSKERCIEAREKGLTYIPVIWILESHDLTEGVVDIDDKRELFAFSNSGCISNPKLRERLYRRLEEAIVLCEAPAVVVDALRYPSPHDGTTFVSCFCEYCKGHARELDIDLDRVKENISRLLLTLKNYPHIGLELVEALLDLIRLRQYVVGDLLRELREQCKDMGVELRATIFPPGLAWLVGQNYQTIVKYVNEVHIMLYHKCTGAACLNHELASLMQLIKELHANEKIAFILTGISTTRSPRELEEIGIEEHVVLEEVHRARNLLGDKAVPLLWLNQTGLKLTEKLVEYEKITLFSPHHGDS